MTDRRIALYLDAVPRRRYEAGYRSALVTADANAHTLLDELRALEATAGEPADRRGFAHFAAELSRAHEAQDPLARLNQLITALQAAKTAAQSRAASIAAARAARETQLAADASVVAARAVTASADAFVSSLHAQLTTKRQQLAVHEAAPPTDPADSGDYAAEGRALRAELTDLQHALEDAQQRARRATERQNAAEQRIAPAPTP